MNKKTAMEPVGTEELQERIAAIIPSATVAALDTLVEIMNDPKVDPKDRLRAASELLDRAWGKPTNSHPTRAKKRRAAEAKIIDMIGG